MKQACGGSVVLLLALQAATQIVAGCVVPKIAGGVVFVYDSSGNEAMNAIAGSMMQLSCNPNTIQFGAYMATCQADGNWDQTIGTCQTACPDIAALIQKYNRIGTVKFTKSSGEPLESNLSPYAGITATVRCPPKYLLNGSESLSCTMAGSWTSPVPYCEAICPLLSYRLSSIVYMNEALQPEPVTTPFHGVKALLGCDSGFRYTGETPIVCQENGQWSETVGDFCFGNLENCQVGCPEPDSTAGMHFLYTDPVTNVTTQNDISNETAVVPTPGFAVTLKCSRGFTLTGNKHATCLSSGQWDNSLGYCRAICPKLPVQQLGQYSYYDPRNKSLTTAMLADVTATLTCTDNYLLNGSQTTTCLANGSWSNIPGQCFSFCLNLTAPFGGKIIYNNTNSLPIAQPVPGAIASLLCGEAFALVGNGVSSCLANGSWDATFGHCTATCPNNVSMDNGVLEMLDANNSIVENPLAGVSVRGRCNDGFRLNGSAKAICQTNGKWSQNIGVCFVSCPDINVSNAIIDFNTTAGTTVQFPTPGIKAYMRCIKNYFLVGNPTITCKSDGTWSNNLGKCKAICPTENLDNGTIQLYNPVEADIAPFIPYASIQALLRCNVGYQLTSSISTATCLPNGTWDIAIGPCLRVCKTLKLRNAAIITKDRTGQNVSYSVWGIAADVQCNPGFTYNGSVTNLHCQSDGSWDDDLATCNAIPCSNMFLDALGQFSKPPPYYANDVISYVCPNNFIKYSTNQQTIIYRCDANARWSPAYFEECGVTCPLPQQISFGDATMLGTIPMGRPLPPTKVRYTCNDGFTLEGASELICQVDGTWSDRAPKCKKIPDPFSYLPIIIAAVVGIGLLAFTVLMIIGRRRRKKLARNQGYVQY